MRGHLTYRADIDGLRALAVGPVVVFHLAQSLLRGGYVGVDIFFVISGYLISAHILAEVEAGRFSLAAFYERRVRRIFPAYAAVLAFSTLVVLATALPGEARDYGEALAAAVLSLTNVYFWATTGYFALAAEEMPLLHTWSLSVEEQFYLVFPLLVVAAFRWARPRLEATVLALFALSLAASAWGALQAPTGTFYLLPTRGWELLTGTILAMGLVPRIAHPRLRDAAGLAGLALIGAPMALYGPGTPFPGLAALPPCLGAALVIHAGASGPNLASRLLAWRPLVFVGLISYSLYLWHWPLMVFQRVDFLLVASESKVAARGAVLAASLACAVLSWRFIEQPTRDRARVSTRALLVGSGAAAAGLLAVAAALVASHGFPARLSPEAQAVAAYRDYDETRQFRVGTCFLDDRQPFSAFDQADCLPARAGARNYLLLGDSYAASLAASLRRALPDANVLQVTGVVCSPLVPPQPDPSVACPGLIDLALNRLPRERRIDRVFLVARWNKGEVGYWRGFNPDWLGDIRQTVEAFRARGVEAVVLGPFPEYRMPLPRLLARAIDGGDPDLPRRTMPEGPFVLDRRIAAYARENGFAYVSLIDALCPGGACAAYAAPGVPTAFDIAHVTEAGADLVVERILPRLIGVP